MLVVYAEKNVDTKIVCILTYLENRKQLLLVSLLRDVMGYKRP